MHWTPLTSPAFRWGRASSRSSRSDSLSRGRIGSLLQSFESVCQIVQGSHRHRVVFNVHQSADDGLCRVQPNGTVLAGLHDLRYLVNGLQRVPSQLANNASRDLLADVSDRSSALGSPSPISG